MGYRHIKAKPKSVKIQSINASKGKELNDLEATLLCFQKMIESKVKEGKKGIVLFKDTDSEYRMSYKKLQAMLWELDKIFAMRGAFSFGICMDCDNFQNSCSTDGCYGYCKGSEKTAFDSCNEYNGSKGGFGL